MSEPIDLGLTRAGQVDSWIPLQSANAGLGMHDITWHGVCGSMQAKSLTRRYGMHLSLISLLLLFYLLRVLRFARAPTAALCTVDLRSHTPLRPSTIDTSSSATFRAKPPRPLPRVGFLLAASRIHMTACRRRCRSANGIGICNAAPPPAMPFCDRIRRSGATESIAKVR